ncbi:MAG TPA: hypothetical protein VK844_02020 [Hyphomicrobiales bacterium]|nr:hypothetical protein [Hyphomicrobiales bacterium]
MGKADLGSLAVGVLLLIVAVWVFTLLDDPPARYVGTGVLAVIGLAAIASAVTKGKGEAG